MDPLTMILLFLAFTVIIIIFIGGFSFGKLLPDFSFPNLSLPDLSGIHLGLPTLDLSWLFPQGREEKKKVNYEDYVYVSFQRQEFLGQSMESLYDEYKNLGGLDSFDEFTNKMKGGGSPIEITINEGIPINRPLTQSEENQVLGGVGAYVGGTVGVATDPFISDQTPDDIVAQEERIIVDLYRSVSKGTSRII